MFIHLFSPVFKTFRVFPLSSRRPSIYNLVSFSVRRHFSVTTQVSRHGQQNQQPRAVSPITDFPAFRRYLEGQYTEPYGRQGKESRDLFIQTLTKTFESVADAHRRSRIDSSDTPKLINTASCRSIPASPNKFRAAKSLVRPVSLQFVL